MPREIRITVVISDDPDTEETTIRALGDHYLPAPITRPSREFPDAWREFGERIAAFRAAPDQKAAGPWA
jgi:hypothetical protein